MTAYIYRPRDQTANHHYTLIVDQTNPDGATYWGRAESTPATSLAVERTRYSTSDLGPLPPPGERVANLFGLSEEVELVEIIEEQTGEDQASFDGDDLAEEE